MARDRNNQPASVQANLVRASKFHHEQEARNWSLYVFFRLLAPHEIAARARRLEMLSSAQKLAEQDLALLRWELATDLRSPALLNANLDALSAEGVAGEQQVLLSAEGERAAPLTGQKSDTALPHPFLAWLAALAAADKKPLLESMLRMIGAEASGAKPVSKKALREEVAKLDLSGLEAFEAPSMDISSLSELGALSGETLKTALHGACAILAEPSRYTALLRGFGPTPDTSGANAIKGGLAITFLYEMLRQGAPAFSEPPKPRTSLASAVRSEGEQAGLSDDAGKSFDTAPVNIAFTYSGLQALGLDKTTLCSFPEPFRQGMAARAEMLGDVGASAPEFWDGELGSRSVHGYFTGGFHVDESAGVSEAHWKRLRREVAAYNHPVDQLGQDLRVFIGFVAHLIGIEVLHIELGQDPYELEGDAADPAQQKPVRLPHRHEHFGFRDGLSQPFVDLGLGDPAPGGGTPSRNSTWSPVALGEIFLHCEDEDGRRHELPVNSKLREGSTFLVFRKLEQDVVGFRSFIAKQRPGDKAAQEMLAAQFVGRWKNGTPLVLSPDFPREFGPDAESILNDFRYAADDPRGRKCPLGAHVRRSNPRDIGGRDNVRRHRILRRGMSYGGALLPKESAGDGEKRGLLFVAANSRIDLQFETLQSVWINRGEFLGQAGLGRCPLTGAHAGRREDVFLEAGAVAPITEMPAFVRTRAGDFFFARCCNALRSLARGDTFPPDCGIAPYDGHSMNDPVTPALFEAERLSKYAYLILGGAPSVRVPLDELPEPLAVSADCPKQRNENDGEPDPQAPKEPKATAMVFVAQYPDAKRVLHGSEDGALEFSVAHYRKAARAMSRGSNMLVGTDCVGPTADDRERLTAVLVNAWKALAASYPDGLEDRVRGVARARVAAALRRTGPARRIDLIHDLAAETTYAIIDQILGVRGPTWLTELGLALPFSRQHAGELHPEWLAALSGRKPDNPGMASMQIWSVLVLADLIGNVKNIQDLKPLSQQAALEMLTHIDSILARARAKRPETPGTLVDAFVASEGDWYKNKYPNCNYYRDVSMLLFELAGTALAVVPLTFASVFTTLFDFRIDLGTLAKIFDVGPRYYIGTDEAPDYRGPSGWERLVYEAERFNPNMPVRLRQCVKNTVLPSKAKISAGEWVTVIIKAALFDERGGFDKQFSLAPFLPGPERDISKYLLFGVSTSDRDCWGRDRIALIILIECLKAASRLEGLRRVAGPNGEVKKMLTVPIGMWARFTRVR